jgi:hypothetical protein
MKMSEENPYKQKWSNWYMLQICGANFVLHDVIVLVYAYMLICSRCGIYVIKYYCITHDLQICNL